MFTTPKITLFCLLSAISVNTWAESSQNGDQPPKPIAQPTVSEGTILATVNGKVISRAELDAFAAQRKNNKPEQQQNSANLLREMISREVLIQNATEAGMDKRPEFIAELTRHRDDLLINTLLQKHLAEHPFTEEQLQEAYQQQISQMDLSEYRARHILSDSEVQATEIIKELDAGADFIDLAKKRSTGPSAPKGGDLGWFRGQSMVAPFAAAVKGMKKGSYSQKPVQTRFGWHVILLEDVRELKPPAYDKLKGQLQNMLSNQALNAYVADLRQNADIEIKQQP
jgi:peptidyl-prolyl cis-trans isomerase C